MKTVFSIVLALFFLTTASNYGFCQSNNYSESGSLFIETDSLAGHKKGPLYKPSCRPRLEVALADNEGEVNQLFPGANMRLQLVVTNYGNATAEKCWVKIMANSPFIIVNYPAMDVFDLEANESKTIDLNLNVFEHAPLGTIKLNVEVEEYNGYDLFPSRTLTLFINERPDIDLIVLDVAARDHPGKGYIDKFDDADLFFRIQNCANSTFHNVHASVELKNGTFARSMNPRLDMGNIEPKQTRDVEITVSTTMAARNIGLILQIESDEKTIEHELSFEFLADYKAPEQLITDGCEQYIPETGAEIYYPVPLEPTEHDELRNNYYAVIISNYVYINLDELNYINNDVNAFYQHLIFSQGIPPANIHIVANTRGQMLQSLFEDVQTNISDLHSSMRRRLGGKDLVVYYTGYAAADLLNGEIYLLPVDFHVNDQSRRVKLSDLYKQLEKMKEIYNIRSVTAFLNLNFHMVSGVGNKDNKNMLITEMHKKHSGFTSVFNASVFHEPLSGEESDLSPFTKFLIDGLNGLADFNENQKINTSDLTRFMADEFFGVPGIMRKKNQSIQVPFFIGADKVLFE